MSTHRTTRAELSPPAGEAVSDRRDLRAFVPQYLEFWKHRTRAWWWDSVAAVSVCLAGTLLSVIAWDALGEADRRALERSVDDAASDLARAIESGLDRQSQQMQQLTQTWAQFETQEESRWQADAGLFLRVYEEILAIEWDSRRLASGTPFAAGSADGLRLLESRRADPSAEKVREDTRIAGTGASLGPFPGPDGRPVLELVVPVRAEPDHVMTLIALMDPGVALDRILSHRADDLAIEVSLAGARLFRRGDPAGGELADVAAERTLGPVHGKSWTLTARPSRATFASPRWQLRSAVLILGILLSVLISALFWLGRTASVRARDFLAANVELQGRLREIEHAEERARKLDERIAAMRVERRELTQGILSIKAEKDARPPASGDATDPAVGELETFTYSVSHDLRSPMGAILNYAAVLSEDYRGQLGSEGRECLDRISTSAQSAIAMMDGLLAFARVGSQELKIAEVDVHAMVRDVYEELRQARPEKPPSLSMGELPVVRGDRTLLWILFSNLLSNAFKFTHEVDEPRVEVGGYVQGTDVVYYVGDNGIGFDMRHAGKLFRIFERLHTAAKRDGHGIGLAVVDRIARRHGGSVRAEGVPGRGATFFVTLPGEPLPPGGNPT